MRIEYLNHASVIIKSNDQSLLCDPWFSGTAFGGGWGLQYDNPEALQKAASCTHLWISHFHPDHLHMPTLKQLAALSPEIIALANDSANFCISEALQQAGFQNIVPLYERRKLPLTSDMKITRYPTAGIDNMLLIETPAGRILNYNDCHLPIGALKLLIRKIGNVDIVLNSFNHAIKFIDNPRKGDEEIRTVLKTNYKKVLDAINPRWAIPFASAHYYRTRDTQWQNESLLQSEDLAEMDGRILPVRIGSEVTFDDKLQPTLSPPSTKISLNNRDIKLEPESVPFDEVVNAAKDFGKRLKQSLLGLTFWIPELRIRVEEYRRVIRFDVNNQVFAEDHREIEDAHIESHSSALHQWFTKPYGADSFFIGGHFAVLSNSTTPIKRVLLACSLMEKRLSPRSLAQYLLRPSGIKFLLNRREEIFVTLSQRRLRVGDRVS
ncbi:MAG TPA: MBL fold metallo-hydrolase [Pyrinomonadaceae bacterium]|nr:MBL fold metallo-hydrolase [Pyrinomonadaceae bacterium]